MNQASFFRQKKENNKKSLYFSLSFGGEINFITLEFPL